jgi:hypothetical protein
MIDLNHPRNLAVCRRAGSLCVPFVLPALAAFERQSFLLFSWLLLAAPVAVHAQFSYTVNNQTVTITGYTGTSGVVAIPSTIEGLPVTSIGSQAFSGIDGITAVMIPNSVTSIGSGAFSSCPSLTEVTIANSVTSIGAFAFDNCRSLTNILVDPLNPAYSSVDGVLLNQSQTTLLECPGGKVGRYTIPNSVTSIAGIAFGSCTRLTEVMIPNSVTNIVGGYVFAKCFSLTNILVDPLNPAYSSADGVLFNQSQTTLVEYPAGKVGSYTVPDSVTSIGPDSFTWCTNVNAVVIPNGVTNIGDHLFAHCLSMTNVTLGRVTSIGIEAFIGCYNLTNVTIPNSVSSIGIEAFDECTSLSNVTLPNSVTSIAAFAFYICTSLTDVTIPNSVTNIGNLAFAYCTSLASVYFQGNAPGSDSSSFTSDKQATAYYLPGTTGWGSTFGGIPTALWSLPYPVILNKSLGVQSNQFCFTVLWATNLFVVVEASPNLTNPIWSPLVTNSLVGGLFYFNDPQWTEYPSRFYRVRSQ